MGKIRKRNNPRLTPKIVAGLLDLRSLYKDRRTDTISAALDWIAAVHRNELDGLGSENPERFKFQVVETTEDGRRVTKYGSDSPKEISTRVRDFEYLGCRVHVEQNGRIMSITKVGRTYVIGNDIADDEMVS